MKLIMKPIFSFCPDSIVLLKLMVPNLQFWKSSMVNAEIFLIAMAQKKSETLKNGPAAMTFKQCVHFDVVKSWYPIFGSLAFAIASAC